MRHVLLFVLLSACAAQVPVQPAAPSLPDTCNATRQIGLIGQPATALERVMILGQVRIIRPDDLVTLDFRDQRINFYLDDADRITDVRCG